MHPCTSRVPEVRPARARILAGSLRVLPLRAVGGIQPQAPRLLPELRRTAETAALLADEVLPTLPIRQWVISFPFALRFLFATHPDALARAQGAGVAHDRASLG